MVQTCFPHHAPIFQDDNVPERTAKWIQGGFIKVRMKAIHEHIPLSFLKHNHSCGIWRWSNKKSFNLFEQSGLPRDITTHRIQTVIWYETHFYTALSEHFLLNLHSYPHLRPPAVGNDWKKKITDTNELPLKGAWVHLETGWGAREFSKVSG